MKRFKRLLPLLPLAVLLPAAALASEDSLRGHAATRPYGIDVFATVESETPGPFVLYAVHHGVPFERHTAQPVAVGEVTPAYTGLASFVVPPRNQLNDRFAIDLYAVLRRAHGFEILGPTTVPLTGLQFCQQLDFDFSLGQGDDPVPGEIIDEEWAQVGMRISAENNTPGHPDLAILFDSSDPTGGDFDLMTPGPGAGNDTALGNLLIIAENDFDANRDELIDDPDDEEFGGVISFQFDDPVTVCSITLVDVDDANKTHLRFFRGAEVTIIPVDNMGDNSVQTVMFLEQRVDRMDVVFGGSGAIAGAEIQPCPLLINLDENVFGVPIDVAAGLEITDQFANLGLTVSGINGTPGHPDKVILFDSENPTGGDFDLMTPGPGLNNDTPLGLVLIIAENDIDRNMDGLVDDPDDEEFGGRMVLEFDTDVTFFNVTVLDVDGTETDVFEFYDAQNNLIELVEIDALGDNSVQTLASLDPLPNVRRIELSLGGSGAITRLRWCPGNVVPGGGK